MKDILAELMSFDILTLSPGALWLLGFAGFMAITLLVWVGIATVCVVMGAGGRPSSGRHLHGWTRVEPRLNEADFAKLEKVVDVIRMPY
jgi:hypothetical protein